MVRSTRVERATPTFGGLYSIHLSYERSAYYISIVYHENETIFTELFNQARRREPS